MGMSSHVEGYRPPDETWHKMKAIWDAVTAADMPMPEEVREFFNYRPPEAVGIKVEVDEAVVDWKDDFCSGLEVELAKLPPNITHLRFKNCW